MAIGSAIAGALGSSLGDILGSVTSALLSYKQQKKLMKYNYDLSRESRQTAFGDTKQSLLNAGYNPILALTGGQSNTITPSTTGSNTDFGNPLASGIDAYSAISSVQSDKARVQNETIQTQNDTARAENEALESMQRQAGTKLDNENKYLRNEIDKTTLLDRTLAEIDNIKTNSAKQSQEVRNLKQDIRESKSRILKNISETVNTDADTDRRLMENSAEADYYDWRRAHPVLKRADYFGRDTGIKPRDVMSSGASIYGAHKFGKAFKGSSAVSVKYNRR